MATVVVPLNSCYPSTSSTPFQLRNPNFTPLNSKIKINYQRSHYQTPILRASEQDSNPETEQDGEVNNLGVKAALSMLRFYKREISPILPKSCRYVPTCSEYSMEAYKRYGVVKGTVLTAWRLCRCNPLGGYGYDPPRWFGEKSPQEEVED